MPQETTDVISVTVGLFCLLWNFSTWDHTVFTFLLILPLSKFGGFMHVYVFISSLFVLVNSILLNEYNKMCLSVHLLMEIICVQFNS